MDNPEKVTYFAETDARNRLIPFGIKAKDRTRHMYVIGKTGMGKSTLLENMAVQDIQNGNGFAFIDPHGKTADLLLEYIPQERMKDVLYFAPFDMEFPISFNIMEDVGYDKRHLVVSGLMSAFKKIWEDAWSARMEYILSNTLLALLEYPDSTLLSVNKMLADKTFRNKVVANITDTSVKSFWVDEFAKYTERFAAEATPAIQNKIGQFTSNPLIRNIIGQPNSSFDIRKMMDEKKILIINLSKGRIGEANANLLGSLLITKIYLSAMSRADIPERELQKLPNFYLFVDEFQSFANESFADILSEARKYKLNLTIAHQYIEQMSDEVRAAVFGNVGTMISFRIGSYDAEVLEKEFAPVFTMQDIVNLGFAQIYLRLMIDGIGSQPFSAKTLPPLQRPEKDLVKEIINASREQFARPRAIVEEEVKALVEMGRNIPEEGTRDSRGSAPRSQSGGQRDGGRDGATRDSNRDQGRSESRGERGGEQRPRDDRSRTDDRRSDDRRSTEERQPREERRPVIDEKTKNELHALIKAKQQAMQVEEVKDSNWSGNLGEESKKMITEKIKQKGPDPKKVSPEHKSDLKSTLAAVLGSVKEEKPIQEKTENKNENTYVSAPQPVISTNEIPEDELRSIFDVNK